MPEDPERTRATREWVDLAEQDLRMALAGLGMREDTPTVGVCFHAQQCVEKYLKALLMYRGTDFPKTHRIVDLLALVVGRGRPSLTIDEQERLTKYAAAARYPGYPDIGVAEARRAVALARRIRGAIRRFLPSEVLSPRTR